MSQLRGYSPEDHSHAEPTRIRVDLPLITGAHLPLAGNPPGGAGGDPFTITLVSHTPAGMAGNGSSYSSANAMGEYVAFGSYASDLVPGDTNGMADIFLYDNQADTIRRLSILNDGTQANGDSLTPYITSDGQQIAFASYATNLVPADVNGYPDAFLYNRVSDTFTLLSVASDGTQANDYSWIQSLSDDGQTALFFSFGTTLVPGDTNGVADLFIRKPETQETIRVSVGTGGVQADLESQTGDLSADGTIVGFGSGATTLVPSDTNGVADVFVRDLTTGITTRISVATTGSEGNGYSLYPVLSSTGRYVAFFSEASNLVAQDTNGVADIFWHDRMSGETRLVSLATDGTRTNGASYEPSISGDGRYVAFFSEASNLVAQDTNAVVDAFVHDTQTGETRRISVAPNGTDANHESFSPQLSVDGRTVAFYSYATNLTAGDTNTVLDVYLYRLSTSTPTPTPTPSLTPTNITSSPTATASPTTTPTSTATPSALPTLTATATGTVTLPPVYPIHLPMIVHQ